MANAQIKIPHRNGVHAEYKDTKYSLTYQN